MATFYVLTILLAFFPIAVLVNVALEAFCIMKECHLLEEYAQRERMYEYYSHFVPNYGKIL